MCKSNLRVGMYFFNNKIKTDLKGIEILTLAMDLAAGVINN